MKRIDLPVEEFTTPDPIVASENETIDTLSKIMHEHGIRHLPVVSHGKVVGIVSDRDLRLVAVLDLQEKKQILARDIMSKDPITVDSRTPLSEVAFEMSKRKIGSVMVNEGEKLLGIFTATDALNALIEIARGK